VFEILNIPLIKTELKNWDREKIYVSQMIEYDNPVYNHQTWIKVKISPYKEKKEIYQVIQIIDATKEHDRQHLLISQATDIKAREIKLNQITSSSYDMEININLTTNVCDLKYFKMDNKYFGEEKRGKYTDILKEILDKYINEKDKEIFISNLSMENLKNHFDRYELDSISFRYRVGNEVKNNTWLESTIFFLSSRGSNKVSILTKNVTEDAESIREQNYLLQNALNDAKIADKSKTELISTISHDIRTPLTNIIGLSESVLVENLARNVKEDVESIQSASNSLLGIIDRLLDVSKIESGVMELEEKEYNVPRLLKSFEKIAKDHINDKKIDVVLNVSKDIPTKLFGDSGRISQVVLNILDNACKFTEEGTITIDASCVKKANSVKLVISVSDTELKIKKLIIVITEV